MHILSEPSNKPSYEYPNRRNTEEPYLEDGHCSFANNLSENAIRPFAAGQKNWLFSNAVDGANANAVVYTMVEMAKAHDLNIYGYLKFLLEHRPSKDMTDEQLIYILSSVKKGSVIAFKKLLLPLLFSPKITYFNMCNLQIFTSFLQYSYQLLVNII